MALTNLIEGSCFKQRVGIDNFPNHSVIPRSTELELQYFAETVCISLIT